MSLRTETTPQSFLSAIQVNTEQDLGLEGGKRLCQSVYAAFMVLLEDPCLNQRRQPLAQRLFVVAAQQSYQQLIFSEPKPEKQLTFKAMLCRLAEMVHHGDRQAAIDIVNKLAQNLQDVLLGFHGRNYFADFDGLFNKLRKIINTAILNTELEEIGRETNEEFVRRLRRMVLEYSLIEMMPDLPASSFSSEGVASALNHLGQYAPASLDQRVLAPSPSFKHLPPNPYDAQLAIYCHGAELKHFSPEQIDSLFTGSYPEAAKAAIQQLAELGLLSPDLLFQTNLSHIVTVQADYPKGRELIEYLMGVAKDAQRQDLLLHWRRLLQEKLEGSLKAEKDDPSKSIYDTQALTELICELSNLKDQLSAEHSKA